MDIALVGVGGYGGVYLDGLLRASGEHQVRLIAGVDPRPKQSVYYDELVRGGVPLFPSLDAMLAAGIRPELTILSSPLHLHADQAETALARGSHVLCEKPLAATPEDAARMIAARDKSGRDKSGRVLSVGYQWAFAPGLRRLKDDVLAGRFGRPTSFCTKVYWPRGYAYYARNGWAGRLHTADGRAVFDSPVNNACAHFLHHMLHLAGDTGPAADWPAAVTAELYRANPIENYDTAVLRGRTESGVDLMACLSHATERTLEPVLEYSFERGKVVSDASTGHHLIGFFRDAAGQPVGDPVDYGPQPSGHDVQKLWSTVEAIRTGRPVACSAESAAAHAALTAAVQQSAVAAPFGDAHVVAGEKAVYVPGLESVLDRCYAERKLPSELHVPWSKPGREVRIEGLTRLTGDTLLVA